MNRQVDHAAVTLRKGFFQPTESLLFVAETRVEHGPSVRGDVLLTVGTLKLVTNVLGLRLFPRQRIGVRQLRFSRSFSRRQGHERSKLSDGFGKLFFLKIGLAQISMSDPKARVKPQRSLFFLNRPVSVTRQVVTPSDVCVDDQRAGIDLPRELDLRDGLFFTALRRERQCIPVQRRSVP